MPYSYEDFLSTPAGLATPQQQAEAREDFDFNRQPTTSPLAQSSSKNSMGGSNMMNALFGASPAALASLGSAGSSETGAALGGLGGGIASIGSDIGAGLGSIGSLFEGGDAAMMAGALLAL